MSAAPFFLTGANAKILLNNKTVAYCTNVSYKVTVRHATPRVLGRFEVETIQPLSYDVVGTMTLIRYAAGLKDFFGGRHIDTPAAINQAGNGLGSFGPSGIDGVVASLGIPNSNLQFDGAPDENLVPGRLFQSKLFNIEIRQKLPPQETKQFGSLRSRDIIDNVQTRVSQLVTGAGANATSETTVVLLRGCRIEEYSFTLDRRSVATVTLSFKARYADDDSAIARKSGVGQELS